MTSTANAVRKPICRYFMSTGTCHKGDECQYLHHPSVGFQKHFSNGQPPMNDHQGMSDSMGDNGDQFFNATFGTETIPEFPFNRPPLGRPQRAMGGPVMGSGMPGQGQGFPDTQRMDMHGQLDPRMDNLPPGAPGMRMDGYGQRMGSPTHRMDGGMPPRPRPDHGLPTDFQALNLQIPNSKGPNPVANEFIPKSATLTHSASSPNFSTLNGNGFLPPMTSAAPPPSGHMMPPEQMSSAPGLGGPPTSMMLSQAQTMSNTPPPHLAPTSVFSSASPNHSPHLSPSNSPLMIRRTASPITPLKQNVSAQGQKKNSTATIQENVGGTTYFYSPEDFSLQHDALQLPNFSMFPSLPPHIAHLTVKKNMPQFFMPDELKLDILNRHAMTMAQIDTTHNPDIPTEVDNYHNLFPLEPPLANPMQKSARFGYPTTCYKAVNTKDGLTYCLRRIHGFRLSNTKCMSVIDMWKKMYHPNVVQLREVFTTKAFGDNSIVFVYDYFPTAETLMTRHFSGPGAMNGYNQSFGMEGGSSRSFNPSGKGGMNGPRQHAGLLPESMIWAYVVQLSSALRAIHAAGLACRTMDPTKILIYSKSRLRLNCVGILDVLTFDNNQGSPLAVIQHYQQEDLVYLGKVVLALACNTVMAIQRDNFQNSMELIARSYSADLKNFFLYLLTNQNRPRSINDIMPMIGARFYTQLDSAQLRSDVIENELAKEVENGRLFRLLSKLGTINERPEYNLDPQWSETGDRYMLKLFRDYLFHQVDENGAPWIDTAHIIQCLNKLDAGSPEKICLMSRDEHSVLVVSYLELKQNFERAFSELLTSSHHANFT
ncbi:hypothetical protein FSP39_021365 [Pinctada imbricata]|uniref:PAN2-PAN3 deadenylation complex subunit PAN3 n=1 Tax=Pinctada imbricata TaxID=66713 RepID=A0AA88YJL1_PINIB|nr:hypothetical protein FSP39_021365 [Pinctada imbricata]